MKTVYLVRHAKSSWEYNALRDSERPLNDRGLRDAPFMAKILKNKGAEPDAIISSPAVRALTTAMFFKNELGLGGEDVLIKEDIYEAMSATILKVIQLLPEDFESVLLFGHNPTFTSVANIFSDKYIPNMPTCSIVRIDADIDNWSEFKKGKAKVTEFHFPKQYFN
ncbi:MAG TPA: histidine phosphatase family protein [Bacteroidetes bacterium]|nr:histidine phosphatase family protein [Bacteroidota bacterium]